jgi:hypothetical protein
VSDADEKDASEQGAGVLSKLPKTRPQRSSARRAAARNGAAAMPKATPAATSAPRRKAAAKARKPAAKAPPRAAPKKPPAKRPVAPVAPKSEPVPLQGFESEGTRANGPVPPPGGPELLATAAEIVSELTKAGLGAGERLVRDVLSRLPLS